MIAKHLLAGFTTLVLAAGSLAVPAFAYDETVTENIAYFDSIQVSDYGSGLVSDVEFSTMKVTIGESADFPVVKAKVIITVTDESLQTGLAQKAGNTTGTPAKPGNIYLKLLPTFTVEGAQTYNYTNKAFEAGTAPEKVMEAIRDLMLKEQGCANSPEVWPLASRFEYKDSSSGEWKALTGSATGAKSNEEFLKEALGNVELVYGENYRLVKGTEGCVVYAFTANEAASDGNPDYILDGENTIRYIWIEYEVRYPVAGNQDGVDVYYPNLTAALSAGETSITLNEALDLTDDITIPAGVTLYTNGNLTNSATLQNNGAIVGGVTNAANATLANAGDIDMANNNGTMENNGTVSGTLTNATGATLRNARALNGPVVNQGTLENQANATIAGTVQNSGTLTNAAGAAITGTLTNAANATVTNHGDLGAVQNSGVLTNHATITGAVTNATGATLTNAAGATITGNVANQGDLANEGAIDGTVSGNPATGSGTVTGNPAAVPDDDDDGYDGTVNGYLLSSGAGRPSASGSGSAGQGGEQEPNPSTGALPGMQAGVCAIALGAVLGGTAIYRRRGR